MSETVHTMFSQIAPKYDRANTVLSFGIHHLWRRQVVKQSGAVRGYHVLDCATGTGDLALVFKKKVGPAGRVVGTDFNADMLSFAPQKAIEADLDVDFAVADVMDLPYADNEFDVASISFGIRNVDDPQKALAEMARVVKPGGSVVVLEFGQPRGFFGVTYRWYSTHVIPKIGGAITGHPEAYSYLPTTAAAFPSGEQFLDLMRATNAFSSVRCTMLTGGISCLYHGRVGGAEGLL